MAMTPDDLIGGPSLYNPAFGAFLLDPANHDRLAQIFAQNGVPIPPDSTGDITHRDVSQGLGRALQFADAGGPGSLQTPGEQFPPPPVVPPNHAAPESTIGQVLFPPTDPVEAATRGAYVPPNPIAAPPFTDADVATTPGASPGSYHRASQDISGPTPSPDSVNSGGAVPDPSTQEKPGDLNRPDPTGLNPPPGMTITRGSSGGGVAPATSVHPDKTVDSLSKALAGLSAMKPDAFRPSTPQPYHATAQLQRTTLPQALLADMLQAGKPSSVFRLGEALRGRSFA